MTLFEGLFIAHLLGDWLLQTEWQAKNKTTNWVALLIHVGIYHAVVLAFLIFGFGLRHPAVLLVVAGLAVTHAILDRRHFELWLIRTLRLRINEDPERWLVIAIDQSIHLILLAVASILLSGPLAS
jgi:hypothetical protein